MEKRLQVFLSSTYKDLYKVRAQLYDCLSQAGYIPVGMENFPAGGSNAEDHIIEDIDQSDYVVQYLATGRARLVEDQMKPGPSSSTITR
ncbi:MAG: DUF4062 domain-containing protein [Planctomycetes bacterium]|nr:DUF4062 domain-containing protein [Planctomycetota bacterium]